MSYGDPPVRDAELDAFQGKPLTESEAKYEKKRKDDELCADIFKFADWLGVTEGERRPSAYFHWASDWELQRVVLNAASTDEQIAAAARELTKRYLADKNATVLEIAGGLT